MNGTCQHIQDDGERCTNPTMYRRQICYHHWRMLRPNPPVNDVAYVPPTLDCEASVSLVCSNILRSLFAGKITPKFAQSAMTVVRETAKSLRLQGKMGKAGDCPETRLTPFMADYYATMDTMQSKSAAAYPDPQPLMYPARFPDLSEEIDVPEEDSSATGSASSAGEQSASASNTLDNVDTGFQARATRAQLAVLTPNSTTDDENKPLEAARPRAASTTADTKSLAAATTTAMQCSTAPAAERSVSPAAVAAPEGSPWREPWVSVTSTSKAPAGKTETPTNKKPPQSAALSAHQAKLLKKILRHGPKHPQFHKAARLLDHQISRAHS